MEPKLNELLHWAVQNTNTSAPTTTTTEGERKPIKKLDTEIIDLILGKREVVRMKECAAGLTDAAKSMEERVAAAEELEYLVQDLNNANDMESLGIWRTLLGFLDGPLRAEPAATQEVLQYHIAWIIGTSVENDDKCKRALLKLNPIPKIAEIISSTRSQETRIKAIYSLNAILKNLDDLPSLNIFLIECSGFQTLHHAFKDQQDDTKLKFKIINLVFNLFYLNQSLPHFHLILRHLLNQDGFLFDLVYFISDFLENKNHSNDPIYLDYSEKLVQILIIILIKSNEIEAEGRKLKQQEMKLIKDLFVKLINLNPENDFNWKKLIQNSNIPDSDWIQSLNVLGLNRN